MGQKFALEVDKTYGDERKAQSTLTKVKFASSFIEIGTTKLEKVAGVVDSNMRQ